MITALSFPFCILLVSVASASNAQTLKLPDCAALLTELADSSKAINSISVTYVSGDMSLRDKSLPAGSHLRREIAAMRPGFYMHWSFHPHDGLTWENDPLQQRLFVSESRWFNVNPVKNIFTSDTIGLGDGLPGSAPGEFLWFSTGIWPVDRPSPKLHDQCVFLHELPSVATSFEMYEDQEINGVNCWVIGRKNIDRLWIDKSRPSILKAREFYEPKLGRLLQKFVLEDFEEIQTNIWFPGTIRNLLVTDHDSEGKPEIRETVIKIESVTINEDISRRFAWTPRAGALDVTKSDEPRQAVEGGTELLDSYRRFAAPDRSRPSHSSLKLLLYFIVFSGAAWIGYNSRPSSRKSTRA